MEKDNPTLMRYDKNRPVVLCPMLRLHFKLTANSLEGNLKECLEKEDSLGKETQKERIIF